MKGKEVTLTVGIKLNQLILAHVQSVMCIYISGSQTLPKKREPGDETIKVHVSARWLLSILEWSIATTPG